MKLDWDSRNNILDAAPGNRWANVYNNMFQDFGQASHEAARDKPGKQHMVDIDISFLGWYDTFLTHHDSNFWLK